jgi:hypothetical protein
LAVALVVPGPPIFWFALLLLSFAGLWFRLLIYAQWCFEATRLSDAAGPSKIGSGIGSIRPWDSGCRVFALAALWSCRLRRFGFGTCGMCARRRRTGSSSSGMLCGIASSGYFALRKGLVSSVKLICGWAPRFERWPTLRSLDSSVWVWLSLGSRTALVSP